MPNPANTKDWTLRVTAHCADALTGGGQDFTADFKLSSASPRGQSQEELNLTLPFSQISELGSYRIAVGLKPSPEELEYNRRMGQR